VVGTSEPWRLGPADRDQPAGRVLPLLLGGYLEAFRDREPGVRVDTDPEELHQFRVNLRRARSLMAAGRRVFPEEELTLLLALASWMANATSPVRDLDVLLDDLPGLGTRVSPELSDGVGDLVDAIERRRDAAFDELIEALDGERYPVLLRRWQAMSTVFRVGGGDPGPDARRPTGEVVDELVLRAFTRLRKRGKRAMRTDDLEAWHGLRKAMKRFRYLVSAFAPMYEKGSFDKVLRHLSDLQDTLGRLQDHHVQAAIVEEVGIAEGGRTALAAGVIADALHRDAADVHAHCREAWADFDRPKLRKRLHALLDPDDD
jgi:CHAD domain-containing protein